MSLRTGFRPWVPPLLLVASATATDVALTMGLLVLPAANGSGDGGATLRTLAVVFGVIAAALLVAGVTLALLQAGDDEPHFVGWFTIVLLVLGVLGVFPLVLYEWMIRQAASRSADTPVHVFRFVQSVIAAYSVSLLVGGVLRAVRSRVATAWTTCVCICLLPFVPFGTAVGVLWLATVRSRETSPS